MLEYSERCGGSGAASHSLRALCRGVGVSNTIRRYGVLGVVVLTIIMVDQVTKAYIDGSMYLHESISIIPGYFNLTYIRNPGAAFGIMGTTSSGFRLVFFFLTSILAMGLLITIFLRLDPRDWWGQLTIASIFGGAIGNFIDRLQYGEVIDFLDFYINGYHWPAFNVADSAISVGVVSLLLLFAFEKRKPDLTPQEDSTL
jgi:signal peptidase II